MSDLFPELTPFHQGFLPEADGHSVFYELSGNPNGTPALIIHGGPGSGSSPTARRYFDPAIFLIVQFDQRNCGRSLPHGSEPAVNLSSNTTQHLLADIEQLRIYLNVEKWLVLGGSWGATLALAYAQHHPDRLISLVLNSIATTTTKEIDWITQGVGVFFPREWHQFQEAAGVPVAKTSVVGAYYNLLMDPDPQIHQPAADAWCRWEMAIVDVTGTNPPHPRWSDPKFRLCFARLVTHFWHHKAWLEEDQLLRGIEKIRHIPAWLIHGRLDFGSPLQTAWDLHRSWPESRLSIIENAGHDSRDNGMSGAILDAIAGLTANAFQATRQKTANVVHTI